MHIRLVTLFPELFDGPLRTGLVGRAIERGDVTVSFTNPRDFATDRHRTVDDQPYGGGGGMVLRVEPWAAAIEAEPNPGPIVLLTPQGAPLRQAHLVRWAESPGLALVAGRYEGFDERVRSVVTEEVSLGDFILTGGEAAAFAIVDGVVRLRPGTLGNADSPQLDSFSSGLEGLLEYPHYTRPPAWRGLEVPEVLRSGDHGKVERWRRAQSVLRTADRRPDRLLEVELGSEDGAVLEAWRALQPRPRLVLAAPLPLALERLWDLAAAYGVEVELVVGPDPAAGADWAARIARLPDLYRAPTSGARRGARGRRARRGGSPPVEPVPARAWLYPVAAPSPVPPGVRVARLDGAGADAADVPRVPPGALRRGWWWVWGEGLHESALAGRAPPVRPWGPGGPPPAEVALPVQLDRILGEG